jgi:hypothetical protein
MQWSELAVLTQLNNNKVVLRRPIHSIEVIRFCWPDDDPIDGLKHVAQVVLLIYIKKGCVLTVIKTVL